MYPKDVTDLLALTGQQHSVKDPYDGILKISYEYPEGEMAVSALGFKGKRVVDIATLPRFRKRGLARLLVKLSDCNVAYVVTDDAAAFWEAIGWKDMGWDIDKGTDVKVYRR